MLKTGSPIRTTSFSCMRLKYILILPSVSGWPVRFAAAGEKLRLLNLDPVMELLEPYYSPFGRPAVNQTQILRFPDSYAASGLYKHYCLGGKAKLRQPAGFLIGCTPGSLPPLGSYYDFIDRLWLQDKQFQNPPERSFPR